MSSVILPGFYPDPTICRVGDRFYLATSSFEYQPGVPIFASTDLSSWAQLGHVLDAPGLVDVPLGIAGASRGVYAPTLRHHDGVFWMITTLVDHKQRGHLIVHATDPAGPWSEPVWTEGTFGIDPDLAWDDDRCFLTWKHEVGGPQGIWQAQVEPHTGRLLTEPRELWAGTGLEHTEGPHLYRRGDYWYLVVAEGGTGGGHVVSVARAARPDGPFEAHPANPVLTHRSLAHEVQNVGHADLVELADGSWAAVHLGVRVGGGFPRVHVNGRETFLAGVDWVDDWPVFVEDRFGSIGVDTCFADEFAAERLDHRWISPNLHPSEFAAVASGVLRLRAGRSPERSATAALLGVRARDRFWSVEVRLVAGDAALVVRMDDEHWFGVERVAGIVRSRVVLASLDNVLAEMDVPDGPVELVLRAVPPHGPSHRGGSDLIQAGIRHGDRIDVLGEFDGRYLSTEVAGGFTGRIIGLEALGGEAEIAVVRYQSLDYEDAGH